MLAQLLAESEGELMLTVTNRNTIGAILALILTVLLLSPGESALGQSRWHQYWNPYNHVSTRKGALIGGAGGAAIGALAGGWKGALIGGGLGAGAGYLIQRYRNRDRGYGYYGYYSYDPYTYYGYYPSTYYGYYPSTYYGYYPYRHYRYRRY